MSDKENLKKKPLLPNRTLTRREFLAVAASTVAGTILTKRFLDNPRPVNVTPSARATATIVSVPTLEARNTPPTHPVNPDYPLPDEISATYTKLEDIISSRDKTTDPGRQSLFSAFENIAAGAGQFGYLGMAPLPKLIEPLQTLSADAGLLKIFAEAKSTPQGSARDRLLSALSKSMSTATAHIEYWNRKPVLAKEPVVWEKFVTPEDLRIKRLMTDIPLSIMNLSYSDDASKWIFNKIILSSGIPGEVYAGNIVGGTLKLTIGLLDSEYRRLTCFRVLIHELIGHGFDPNISFRGADARDTIEYYAAWYQAMPQVLGYLEGYRLQSFESMDFRPVRAFQTFENLRHNLTEANLGKYEAEEGFAYPIISAIGDFIVSENFDRYPVGKTRDLTKDAKALFISREQDKFTEKHKRAALALYVYNALRELNRADIDLANPLVQKYNELLYQGGVKSLGENEYIAHTVYEVLDNSDNHRPGYDKQFQAMMNFVSRMLAVYKGPSLNTALVNARNLSNAYVRGS